MMHIPDRSTTELASLTGHDEVIEHVKEEPMTIKRHRAARYEGNVLITLQHRDKDRDMLLHCSWEQYMHGIDVYKGGSKIQDAFPFLRDDEREFLMSGLYPEEYAELKPRR